LRQKYDNTFKKDELGRSTIGMNQLPLAFWSVSASDCYCASTIDQRARIWLITYFQHISQPRLAFETASPWSLLSRSLVDLHRANNT
jgi:hypothetical protein